MSATEVFTSWIAACRSSFFAPEMRTASPWIEAATLSLESLISFWICFAFSCAMPTFTVIGCFTLSPEIFSGEPADQAQRRLVAGLDVGLQPMEPQSTKGIGNRETQAVAHEAPPFMRRERVIAEIGAAKCAAHDFADVDDADQLAGSARPDEVG